MSHLLTTVNGTVNVIIYYMKHGMLRCSLRPPSTDLTAIVRTFKYSIEGTVQCPLFRSFVRTVVLASTPIPPIGSQMTLMKVKAVVTF